MTRSVLAAERFRSAMRAGGRRWAAWFEDRLGQVLVVRMGPLGSSRLARARARAGGEYGVLRSEAPTRGSLVDGGGCRVGCSAPGDLSGARAAGGRALSRCRRLVRGVRAARVASPAREPGGAVDGHYGIAVLRARNARPVSFVVCRDDRYCGFELLDHHVCRAPALVPRGSASVGFERETRDRRVLRRGGRARARVDAVRRSSPQPRGHLAKPAGREHDRQSGQFSRVCRGGFLGDPSLYAVAEGNAPRPPCQRSGRSRSAHPALPGWAHPAGSVHSSTVALPCLADARGSCAGSGRVSRRCVADVGCARGGWRPVGRSGLDERPATADRVGESASGTPH